MAEIAPFRGLLYDSSAVEISDVLAPPYDVISPEGRARLAAHPHNCVHLILPEPSVATPSRYEAAAQLQAQWEQAGVLRQDDAPAIYRYHQRWRSAQGGGLVRKGFVAAVRLHPFTDGVIVPHERTLDGPKADRLALMEATRSHYSQIFGLFEDAAGQVTRAFANVDARPPDLEGQTDDGVVHQVWRVHQAEVVGVVARALAPKKIYIADGHHRYETMLALRDRPSAIEPGPAFGTMFLMPLDDAGLSVLPTHRVVEGEVPLRGEALVDSLREIFDIEAEGDWRDVVGLTALFARRALSRGAAPILGVVEPTLSHALWLTPRSGVDLALQTAQAPVLAALPVTWLHRLILEPRLGISAAAQAAGGRLLYIKDTAAAVAAAKDRGALVFLVPPASVAQVCEVADRGLFMPQKSTFFYPKIASGLVMRRWG